MRVASRAGRYARIRPGEGEPNVLSAVRTAAASFRRADFRRFRQKSIPARDRSEMGPCLGGASHRGARVVGVVSTTAR
jgi:hypothetical protein